MADDDLALDTKDLLDIFGGDDAGANDDLSKSLEDLFFSDDDGDGTATSTLALDGLVEAPELPPMPATPSFEEAAGGPLDLEPDPVEPDRKGMTEEEWRASPDYQDFKKKVLERYLQKKQAEERAKADAEEKDRAEVDAVNQELEAKRKTDLLEKYKAAKTAAIAQKAQAMVDAPPPQNEAEKEQKFKNYLQDLKTKMAQGGLPKLPALKAPGMPIISDAGKGLDLDAVKCKALAAMSEECREILLKLVAEKIGLGPARAMMKKTLAKVAKAHLDILGRAAVNAKNELREDGALDQDRLARAFYATPAGLRVSKVQKALYELTEMRFIATELGLGARAKGFVISKLLDALEKTFAKKNYDAALKSWFMNDVLPSTSLSEGEEDSY